jgi:mannose-6-phosphate isomerase-like protein (cupin superfamily)
VTRNHSGPVRLADKFAAFDEPFAPRRIAHVNDFVVKAVKVRGEFVWHSHADTDEMFLVHRGSMTVRYRDRDVVLGPGQLHVVPRGIEHMTLADDTCEALIFEPAETINTGDSPGELTADDEPFI